MAGFKKCKCKHCGEMILKEEDRIKFQISRRISVNLHKDCSEIFINQWKIAQKEKVEWENCYNYIRDEIMEYPNGGQLTNAMRVKLQSLRSGNLVMRGTKINKEGYSYEVILNTFILMKQQIKNAIMNKVFTDENHKFNYIFKIILDKINDVNIRMDKVKREKELAELREQQDQTIYKSMEEQIKAFQEANKEPQRINPLLKDMI